MLVNVELPSQATVIAVERNRAVTPFLELALSHAGINAQVIPCACAEAVGTARLHVDKHWSGLSRLVENNGQLEAEIDSVVVPTTTLTALLKECVDPHSRVLVKIDVEGQEAAVLRGASSLLGSVDAFVALVEIIHLSPADKAWLIEHFEVGIYDRVAACIVPGTLAMLQESEPQPGMTDRYYLQDVVLRPKDTGSFSTVGQ